jgi:hypothetical protein
MIRHRYPIFIASHRLALQSSIPGITKARTVNAKNAHAVMRYPLEDKPFAKTLNANQVSARVCASP